MYTEEEWSVIKAHEIEKQGATCNTGTLMLNDTQRRHANFDSVAKTSEVKEDVDPALAAYRERMRNYYVREEGKLCVVVFVPLSA